MDAHLLEDRVCVVTGVSRRAGIGFAVCERLLADGARVLAHAWVPHDAEQPWGADAGAPGSVTEALDAGEGRLEHFAADLACRRGVLRAVHVGAQRSTAADRP